MSANNRILLACHWWQELSVINQRWLIGSLSMQWFWATMGNRNWTFPRSGQRPLPDFQTNRLLVKRDLKIKMQQSEVKFNGKTAHFRLPSLAQKGCMLKLPNAMKMSAHSQSNRCLQLKSYNLLSLKSCSVSVTTFILVPVQTLVSDVGHKRQLNSWFIHGIVSHVATITPLWQFQGNARS